MSASVFPVIDLPMTGLNIEKRRRAAGLSVRQVQEYFGFEYPQAVYKWQHGESLPSVDNLLALARLLGVSMEELLVCRDQELPLYISKHAPPCPAFPHWTHFHHIRHSRLHTRNFFRKACIFLLYRRTQIRYNTFCNPQPTHDKPTLTGGLSNEFHLSGQHGAPRRYGAHHHPRAGERLHR